MGTNLDSRMSAKPSQSSSLFWTTILVLVSLIALAGIVGRQRYIWDGGFPNTAFELTFLDASGQPLQGVQLYVDREDGRSSFHRPVNDYYSGRIPTSDETGLMVFHCVDIKFGGHCEVDFFIFDNAGCTSPQYDCQFVLNGKEIHRARFNDLVHMKNNETREARTIKIPTQEQIGEMWMNGQLNDPIDESILREVERELFVVRKAITIE